MSGVFKHWPNRITAMRFVGAVLLFVILALIGDLEVGDELELFGSTWPVRSVIFGCFWLFVVLAVTDVLDGYLARQGGHVSVFGRIADPFVDKVLIVGTLIFMTVLPWARERIPAWFVVVIVAREFLVTGLRGYVESLGMEFSADRFGKAKMLLQCFAVGGAFLIPGVDWSEPVASVLDKVETGLIWGTLLATIGSGGSYLLRTRELLGGAGS